MSKSLTLDCGTVFCCPRAESELLVQVEEDVGLWLKDSLTVAEWRRPEGSAEAKKLKITVELED